MNDDAWIVTGLGVFGLGIVYLGYRSYQADERIAHLNRRVEILYDQFPSLPQPSDGTAFVYRRSP